MFSCVGPVLGDAFITTMCIRTPPKKICNDNPYITSFVFFFFGGGGGVLKQLIDQTLKFQIGQQESRITVPKVCGLGFRVV